MHSLSYFIGIIIFFYLIFCYADLRITRLQIDSFHVSGALCRIPLLSLDTFCQDLLTFVVVADEDQLQRLSWLYVGELKGK
jgi:hypothetical protein